MLDAYADTTDRRAFRVRLAALALGLAGIFLVLYPALRPFNDVIPSQGAIAFSSPLWVVAHSLAMIAFILLMLGLLGLHFRLEETPAERLAFVALVVTGLGVGLILP